MKSLIQTVAVAVALIVPVASFAQSNVSSNGPVTRAQVRAELVQLEKAGYSPARGSDPHYPDDLLAAEAKVAAQNKAVGGVADGSSASGAAAAAARPAYDGMKPVYFGQ
ncbi:hypothetical protein F4827_003207 [Paraburkholderia bannensis]|uniref:DUF4148 domain-containing protein n=1 Tax=Paraburkholderia bannensis TaxID=765414 RepID=A0A7W9TXQ3_9BURK|nr:MULTISPECIES: DUF4148 domain-containing protein [Paraburkholderia]MBB3258339.1 hypothetical protein [Paraburkholderia sp. WP4_3_2]MBB6103352.1 hypothetical protein [Paraburkholderia bannensis]